MKRARKLPSLSLAQSQPPSLLYCCITPQGSIIWPFELPHIPTVQGKHWGTSNESLLENGGLGDSIFFFYSACDSCCSCSPARGPVGSHSRPVRKLAVVLPLSSGAGWPLPSHNWPQPRGTQASKNTFAPGNPSSSQAAPPGPTQSVCTGVCWH